MFGKGFVEKGFREGFGECVRKDVFKCKYFCLCKIKKFVFVFLSFQSLCFFSKLRACNVSVVASGVKLHVGKSLFSSKAVWRGPGSPTLVYVRKNALLNMYPGVFNVFCIIRFLMLL